MTCFMLMEQKCAKRNISTPIYIQYENVHWSKVCCKEVLCIFLTSISNLSNPKIKNQTRKKSVQFRCIWQFISCFSAKLIQTYGLKTFPMFKSHIGAEHQPLAQSLDPMARSIQDLQNMNSMSGPSISAMLHDLPVAQEGCVGSMSVDDIVQVCFQGHYFVESVLSQCK